MLNSGGSVNTHIEASKPSSFEFPGFEKGDMFDLGHPCRMKRTEQIGAVQAVSREAYFTATEASGLGSSNGTPPDISGHKKNRFPDLRGGNSSKSLEAMVKHTGKESLQWGLAAGVYSGITYGLKEARGAHDWKNSAVAGAITGVALALTSDCSSHEQIVQCAITGAAISSAANLLSGIF
ncbi:hypothetical protein ACLB2K_034753 [Fragaria x ananassa]